MDSPIESRLDHAGQECLACGEHGSEREWAGLENSVGLGRFQSHCSGIKSNMAFKSPPELLAVTMRKITHWISGWLNSLYFWAMCLLGVAVCIGLLSQLLYHTFGSLPCWDWRADYMPFARAADQLHKAAMTVGGVLAGFTMIVVYTENRRGELDVRLSNVFVSLMSVASVAFVCAFCVSGLYLFSHQGINRYETNVLLLNLTALSGGAGAVGMLSFLAAFGVQGYLTSRKRGRFMPTVTIAALSLMALAAAQVARHVI